MNRDIATHPDIPIDFAKLTLRDSQVVWLYEAHIARDSVVAARTDVSKQRVAFTLSDVASLEAGRSNKAWDLTVASLVGGFALALLMLATAGN